MILRAAVDQDWGRLGQMLESSGFDYKLPAQNAFLDVKVIEDDHQPRMAILARPTVELYMLADSSWATPGWRFKALQTLHEAMRQELARLGIRDAHAWLPPSVERTFGSRLCRSFGWGKSRWQCYERTV